MEGKRQPNKYLDDKICEEFQSSLDREKIKRLWHSFREAGNSTEGRIQKSVQHKWKVELQKSF